MKAFITGGTGFIGNNLARKLISEEDHQVGLLVREKSKTWRTEDLYGKVDFLSGDLTNQRGLTKLVYEYNPDFIYHFGAYGISQLSQQNVQTMLYVNVGGTLNLIEAAKGIPIINIGSSSEYGTKKSTMIETDKCQPNNWYGKTKFMQTLCCKEYGIPTLRFFSVYGQWGEPERLIPVLMKAKLNGGKLHLINSVRDYAYIDDIIMAVLKATEKYDGIKGEIINIGAGQQYSMKDVLNTLDKIDSRKLKITWDFDDVQIERNVWAPDISKAKRLIDWEPKIPLEDGLRKTFNWYKENFKEIMG